MSYLSFIFMGFVLLLGILYYIAQKKSLGWVVLLTGSVLFYCSFDLRFLFFLAFNVLSTYLCARKLIKTTKKKEIFVLCILGNVGVWFGVKVLPWTISISSKVLNYLDIHISWDISSIVVPIGISYFTLQSISYLADVYSGKIQPEKNLAKYLLFITYFPAIVQGPISRYNELMPQLLNTKPYCFETMRKGIILIMFGLVKKMVVADRLAIFVNACFEQYKDLSGVILYTGAICYSIQLYMDFSGCVDLCRGTSTLFNVELPNNFNRPYLATSIKEFWEKWHMSLSRWLKDYVYIPFGGNRKGTARKYLNLFITFLVSGLWHGAGFSFFVWGALHAIFQIVGQCTIELRQKIKTKMGISCGSVSEKIYQILITFNLVNFAWIFFRAPSLGIAIQYIFCMCSNPTYPTLRDGSFFELGVIEGYFIILLLHVIIFGIVELYTKNQDCAINIITNQHIVIRWGIYLILIFDVILFGVYGKGYDLSGFLYGGF